MSYSAQNPTADALLAHADWAHALARQLVQDVATADDVVQEAWLAALRTPPETGRPLRPWLATVLRNTAGQFRRRSASRLRREQAVASAEALPSAVEVVEKAESQRVLVDKVLALPAPYRETILLRYFENASAADIARRLEVPAATVRWRVQKGIALLRELLDAERDGDQRAWALAMLPLARAPWSGLTGSSLKTAGASSAAAITGVLIVKKIVLPVAAVALLGLGVWVAAPSFGGGVPIESEVTAEQETGGAVALETEQTDISVEEPVARDRIASEVVAAVRGRTTTVIGRCVGEDGAPIADCELGMYGAAPNLEGPDANRGPVLAASATSAADGSFEFQLELMTDSRYTLTANREGLLQTYGRLSKEMLASRKQDSVDIGDIVMRRGARMRATVVDSEGVPVPDVYLVAEVGIPSIDGNMPIQLQTGRSKPDGSLTFRSDPLLMPGSWEIRSPQAYEIISPSRLVVPLDESTFAARIIVRAKTGEDAIAGRVLAESGEPQANIEIAILRNRNVVRSIHSAEDGSFMVYRESDSQTEVVLRAVGEGELLSAYSESLSWGTSDVELLMRSAGSLDLTVVDDQGQAVEEFGVAKAWSEDAAANKRIEHKGTHPGGILRLPGIGRGGSLALLVWPTTSEFAVPMPVKVALPESGSTSVTVTLPRRKAISLRVLYPDGRPAVGSKVELVQAKEIPLSSTTLVTARESVMWNLDPSRDDWAVGFHLDEAVTDESGRARLHGPLRDRVGIRVTSANHPPKVVFPVTPSGEELELVVDLAAILSGAVLPANLESRFRRNPSLALPTEGRPALILRRPGEREPINTAGGEVVPIAEDGSFRVEGLPSGRLEVLLQWLKPISQTTRQTVYMEPPLAIVDLTAGQEEVIQLDASHLIPGQLEGRVLLAGEPVSDEAIRLVCRRNLRGREVFDRIEGAVTDEDGRFSLGALMPGAYSLSVRRVDAEHGEIWLSSSEWVQVSAGRVSEMLFQVKGRRVQIRIVAADGLPVGNRSVTLLHEGMHRFWSKKTDADGNLALADVPSGTLRLRLHPVGDSPRSARSWQEVAYRKAEELDPIEVGAGSEELVIERVLR
ncbi:MAG: sigma-70 family RNA polymerase sigma factor [Planctomycetota bacterium]|jgi:RNA polymerase sigma-70 factor (ECF subfamily)